MSSLDKLEERLGVVALVLHLQEDLLLSNAGQRILDLDG